MISIEQNHSNVGTIPNQAPFFAVSTAKFVLMSITTLGIYQYYWFYRNWALVKQREQSKISPLWRSFLAPIYCRQLYERIRDYPVTKQGRKGLMVGLYGTCWFATTLLWRLPDPYWLVSLFSFVFMLPVLAETTQINAAEAPNSESNNKFSTANKITVIVGGIFMALVVVGAFMGPA